MIPILIVSIVMLRFLIHPDISFKQKAILSVIAIGGYFFLYHIPSYIAAIAMLLTIIWHSSGK